MAMKYLLVFLPFLLLGYAGCASHNAAPIPQLGFDLRAQQDKVEDKGLLLMVRPIHEKSHLKTYFDDDILQYGVLPIQIHICNKSHGCPVLLSTDGLTLQNATGELVPAMSMDQVMEKVEKSFGRTAGWTVAFGIFGLIPSAINVNNTNDKIRSDYESRTLKGGNLVPGAVTEGLVFYNVPPDLSSLNGWKLTLVVVDPTKGEPTSLIYGLAGTVVPRPLEPESKSDEYSIAPEDG
jgi:hypothetical protein